MSDKYRTSQMAKYRTSQIAKIIGVHPNTIRLYENLKVIPPVEREPNGYRVFTDRHVKQCMVLRLALQVEIVQNGLRRKAVETVKTSAACDYEGAITLIDEYIDMVRREHRNADEAVAIVKAILSEERGGDDEQQAGDGSGKGSGNGSEKDCLQPESRKLRRREVSDELGITMDTLRNWEMNGLLTVKRMQNGYRVYTEDDIRRLKIIRALRLANYSLESILRLLRQIDRNPGADIEKVLNTPEESDTIVYVCDKLIDSLTQAEANALEVRRLLDEMRTGNFQWKK